MTNRYYYKIINDITGEIECYVEIDVPLKPEKVCEVLRLSGYHAEPTTKKEYENNTEDEELGADNA